MAVSVVTSGRIGRLTAGNESCRQIGRGFTVTAADLSTAPICHTELVVDRLNHSSPGVRDGWSVLSGDRADAPRAESGRQPPRLLAARPLDFTADDAVVARLIASALAHGLGILRPEVETYSAQQSAGRR
jgi:hypothetical protein